MAKPIKTTIKLQIKAGEATPAPPIGPALGQHGVNIGAFVQQFNEATKEMKGDVIPAEITIYEDRSFEFKLKTPPASALIKKAVGEITRASLREIAEKKMVDLNANDVEAAMKTIEGTARNMGIKVVD
jgi:large subunit ribosomal protein L11